MLYAIGNGNLVQKKGVVVMVIVNVISAFIIAWVCDYLFG